MYMYIYIYIYKERERERERERDTYSYTYIYIYIYTHKEPLLLPLSLGGTPDEDRGAATPPARPGWLLIVTITSITYTFE